METWNQRLARALSESEFKPHQLAQALGLKTPSVSAWLGAGTIQPAKNITGENLLRVCQLLRIRPEWLMFREGGMRPPAEDQLSEEMKAIFEELRAIDRMGGTEREDTIYFINRLLHKDVRQQRAAR